MAAGWGVPVGGGSAGAVGVKGWLVLVMAGGDVHHVVPFEDLVKHELVEDCVCVPQCEVIVRAAGSDVHQFVHSSLDGRELSESP
jgi:hypothetical protein